MVIVLVLVLVGGASIVAVAEIMLSHIAQDDEIIFITRILRGGDSASLAVVLAHCFHFRDADTNMQ